MTILHVTFGDGTVLSGEGPVTIVAGDTPVPPQPEPEPPPAEGGFIPNAGYDVIGNFVHGGEVRIRGTFGKGPRLAHSFAPIIESQAVGTQLNGNYDGVWWSGPKIGSVDCVVVDDSVRGRVLEKIPSTLGSSVGCEFGQVVQPMEWVYLSYWVARTGRKWDASPSQAGQHKLFRISTDWSDPNPDNPNFHVLWSLWEQSPGGVGQSQSYFTAGSDGANAGQTFNDYVGWPDYKTTEWIRVEAEWFTGSVDGNPTKASFKGATRVRGEKRQLREDKTPAILVAYRSGNALRHNGALFQNYFGNGYTGAGSVCRHDDHYVQVGSRARIELTNHEVWGEETAAESQVPKVWDPSEVKIKLNLGAFQYTRGLYLQEIQHDGTGKCIGRFKE